MGLPGALVPLLHIIFMKMYSKVLRTNVDPNLGWNLFGSGELLKPRLQPGWGRAHLLTAPGTSRVSPGPRSTTDSFLS